MLEVSCAIIVNATKEVLVTQRSASMKLPLKIEFPGGKIEQGESAAECLVREIKEELNLVIKPTLELPFNIHQYPDFAIKLIPFVCEIVGGSIQLKEHAAYMWLPKNELHNLDWAAADVPIMQYYMFYAGAQ